MVSSELIIVAADLKSIILYLRSENSTNMVDIDPLGKKKATYARPQLIVYGSINKITLGIKKTGDDGQIGGGCCS
jgi:hypothetical protein